MVLDPLELGPPYAKGFTTGYTEEHRGNRRDFLYVSLCPLW